MSFQFRYRKNLKMSPGKLAAQCVHAALMIREALPHESVIVLGVSDAAFDRIKVSQKCAVVADLGLTEVAPGTETVLAWIEE